MSYKVRRIVSKEVGFYCWFLFLNEGGSFSSAIKTKQINIYFFTSLSLWAGSRLKRLNPLFCEFISGCSWFFASLNLFKPPDFSHKHIHLLSQNTTFQSSQTTQFQFPKRFSCCCFSGAVLCLRWSAFWSTALISHVYLKEDSICNCI